MVRSGLILLILSTTLYGWQSLSKKRIELSEEESLSAPRLKNDVRYIAEHIGLRNYAYYSNLEKTAEYIIRKFRELGYDVVIEPYKVGNQIYKNIIAMWPGQNSSDEVMIIGAHYDSCFNPGADDNASGIAGVLELARLLKDQQLNKRIKFIAFTNEEPPFFMTQYMGSRVYARKVKANGEKIEAAIILETIGFYSEKPNSQKYLPLLGPFYPNRANFVAVVGNFHSKDIVSKITSSFKKSSDFSIVKLVSPDFIPGINFSDHWSFWQEGFPAIMVTDTAYLRNPHYHQSSDRVDTLDYEKMALVIHGLKDSIIRYIQEEIHDGE